MKPMELIKIVPQLKCKKTALTKRNRKYIYFFFNLCLSICRNMFIWFKISHISEKSSLLNRMLLKKYLCLKIFYFQGSSILWFGIFFPFGLSFSFWTFFLVVFLIGFLFAVSRSFGRLIGAWRRRRNKKFS